MSYEQKAGQGVLFENERKKSDSHPDFRGSFVIPEGFKEGDTLYLCAWDKETRNGKRMVSLSHDSREQAYHEGKTEKRAAPREDRRPSPPRDTAGARASGSRDSARPSSRSSFTDDLDTAIACALGWGDMATLPDGRVVMVARSDEIPF